MTGRLMHMLMHGKLQIWAEERSFSYRRYVCNYVREQLSHSIRTSESTVVYSLMNIFFRYSIKQGMNNSEV